MQTATNQETGERIVLVGDKWEPFERSATNEKGAKAFLVRGQWITDTPSPQTSGERSAYGTLGQGINVGLAQIVGAPVDILNAGLGLVGLGSEKPFGGSKFLREQAARIPTGAGPLTYQTLEDVPQEFRPIARAGEAIGASVPIAAAPFGVTREIGKVPGLVRPIVQAARSSPGKFAATEAGGALGAAQGAAVAELLAPGSHTAAVTGEMAGGFVNPIGAAARAAGGAGRGLSTLVKGFTRGGQETKAAETIQQAMLKAGENPERVAQLLREADLEGIALTAGQKSESPTLLALEATIASKNPNFDAAMRTRTQENMANLRKLIGQLEASGDPQLLKEAARMRGRYFDSLLQGRLEAARARMERTQTLIGGDKGAASARATQILEDALGDARKAERALWEEVPKDIPIKAENTIAAHANVRSKMLPEEPLPPAFIENFVKRISKRPSPESSKLILPEGVRAPTTPTQLPDVSSGELLRFRSQMLANGREARAQSKWSEARIYEDMADGALADLAAMEGGAASEARAFSRSLNETFSRTFASDALAVKATGAERIAPEAVLQRAYGSGGALSNKRFQDLEAAAQFSGKSMIQEQEEFLRAAATASVDPQTGRVNPGSLEGFMRNNAQMLNRYPALKKDLANASIAEQTFRNVQAAGEQASKAIQHRAAFAEVLRNENPAQAVRNVVNSANPQRGYEQLIKLARRGPQGSVDGLKAATLDYAARQATGATGDFSFERYRQVLNPSVPGRDSSLLRMMLNGNVMQQPEAARLTFILRNAERIERSLASKAKMSEVVGDADALFDLVVRAVGANIGGASVFGQASGAPIVLAGAGSKAARNLFEKLPRTRILDVIQEASQNPKFMAALLEKPASPVHARFLERQINAFLIQAGLVQRDDLNDRP